MKKESEWYVDKDATKYARNDKAISANTTRKGLKNVYAFYVKKDDDFRCVLINRKQEIICAATNILTLCYEIDLLQLYYDFSSFEEQIELESNISSRNSYIKEIEKFIK